MFCVSSNFSISRFWFLLSVSSSTSYFRSSSCRVNKSHYSIIEESFLTYIKNSSTHFTILLNVNVLIFASFFSSNMHLTDSIIQTLPQKVGWDGGEVYLYFLFKSLLLCLPLSSDFRHQFHALFLLDSLQNF